MARDLSTESWYKHQWRPTTAWVYLAICVFDFLIAPILTGIYFARYGGTYVAWKPITLAEGGLFHVAMGTILGITSWTRGQEMISHTRSNSYKSSYDRRSTGDSLNDLDNIPATKYNEESDFRDNLLNSRQK